MPLKDPQQDVLLLGQPATAAGRTLARFARRLQPCDTEHDNDIRPVSAQWVLWAFGSGPAGYHGTSNRGSKLIDFQPGLVSMLTTLLPPATATGALPTLPLLPPIELPKVPNLGLPPLPKLELPKLELPKLNLSNVELPKVEFPKLELPKLP